VVDNTLVVHHPPTAVAVLFDVALHSNRTLANPLPLRRLQLLPPDVAAAAATELEQQQQQQQQQQMQGAAATGDAGSSAAGSSEGDSSSGSSTPAAGGQQDVEGGATSGSIAGSSVRVGSFSSLSRTRAGFRRTLITVPAAAAAGSSGSNAAAAVAAAAAGSAAAAAAAAAVYESSEVLEEGGWVFFLPGIVLDKGQKTVGRLQLDLQVCWVCVCERGGVGVFAGCPSGEEACA
jgi:hypothetical protein